MVFAPDGMDTVGRILVLDTRMGQPRVPLLLTGLLAVASGLLLAPRQPTARLSAARTVSMAVPDEVAEAMEDAAAAAAASAAAAAAVAASSVATSPPPPRKPDSAPLRSDAIEQGLVDVDLCVSLSTADAAQVAGEAGNVFRAIDSNGDGVISSEELRSHLSDKGYSTGAVQAMFEALDTNKDGEISPQELRDCFMRASSANLRLALGLPAKAARSGPSAEADDGRTKLADELFDAIDTNGDGEISALELSSHLQKRAYSLLTVDAIFSALDLNSDGAVSRAELRGCFGRYEYSALRLALGISEPK